MLNMSPEKSGEVGGSGREEEGILKPLLEADEFEIADKDRSRCKGNNGGVNAN